MQHQQILRNCLSVCLVSLFAVSLAAQGVTAGAHNQYMVDQPASASLGLSSPIPASALTDSLFSMNIQGFPVAAPVVMVIDRAPTLGATISINAFNMFNIQMDLRDVGGGGYFGQVLFNGFENPIPENMTNVLGQFSQQASIPSCVVQANIPVCFDKVNYQEFEIGSQALVNDPTNAPFNVQSTPAIQGHIFHGYRKFNLNDAMTAGEDSKLYQFKQGFKFRFYGVSYTECHVSSNGHISFGAADGGFPNPSVNSIRTGVPRIMSYFNDLVPEDTSYAPNTRIYVQQFRDASGVNKVKFVHDFVAEFGDATGPHGGEITLTENDEIAIYVPGYQGNPSINTGVGISPGGSIDPFVSGFGQDLSARFGTGHLLGAGKSAYEVFDHGFGSGITQNPIDLYGFANNQADPIGRGIKFVPSPFAVNTAPANSRYIIQ